VVQHVHHPAFPHPPNPGAAIWRYLTRHKFEWMVSEARLFMPSAAHLGDPLEGTQPSGDLHWWQSLFDRASSEEERRTIEHNRELLSRFAAAFRTRYYVSCWHVNEAANAEMWRLYADSAESVAVRTTVEKLRAALPVYVEIGLVRYIDYAVERLPTLNMLEYITHKNKLFENERELRAVAMHPIVEGLDQQHFREHYFQADNNPAFLVFAPPVDIAALVEVVLVHPDAPKPFFEKIVNLCETRGLPRPERHAW